MADISKIKLPSGNVYDIKDSTAREMIAGGISFIVAWDGTAAPVVANVPAGVVIHYNDTDYTGTLSTADAQLGAFYLVKSSTQVGAVDVYDEYIVATINQTKQWEKLGDTQVNLADVVMGVTLNKSTDVALGEATTFALASGTVTHGTPTTDTFVKSVSAETNKKLVTTSIPNITSVGSAATWAFAMGTGTGNTETLIISGANGSAPTLGTAITAATGATDANGSGDSIVTGVTIGSSASAITAMPSSTVGTSITVGTNDKITTLTNSTSITVTKGS